MPPLAPSNRCGSQRESMMSRVQQLFTGSASKLWLFNRLSTRQFLFSFHKPLSCKLLCLGLLVSYQNVVGFVSWLNIMHLLNSWYAFVRWLLYYTWHAWSNFCHAKFVVSGRTKRKMGDVPTT